MAKYGLTAGSGGTQQNMTTTYKTVWSLTAATGATTLRKVWIYDMTFSADGTPADNVISYVVNRQTTVGTGTTATPAKVDDTDAAALIVATVNHTVEPTITAATQLFEMAINQRASHRWVVDSGSDGKLVVPAVNVNGIGGRAKSPAYASTVMMGCQFME